MSSVCKGSIQTCVWHKTNVVAPLNDKFYDAFEFITVAYGSKASECPSPAQFVLGGINDFVKSEASTINVIREHAVEHKLCYTTADKLVVSPYQKPVRLLKKLIVMFSHEGDWILDGCAGAGSTMVAAATMGRNVLSVDIDPRCCQFMSLRLSRWTICHQKQRNWARSLLLMRRSLSAKRLCWGRM